LILRREPVRLSDLQLGASILGREFDIVVVGGGIAGLSAGLTAARLGRSSLVLTGTTLGGHLISIEKIDGYPGFPDGVPGYDLCPIAQEQGAAAGAEFAMTELTALRRDGETWRIEATGESLMARSVIVASGTRLRDLGVPGEATLRGHGVSQCASCDAPLLRNQAVVVAGGGDSALQEALTLAAHCSSVTIVHHGEAYSGQAAYRSQIENQAKISSVPESEIGEILGDGAVTAVRIRSTASGAISERECAAAFVFVGLAPNTSFIADASILDDAGYVVTDTALRTALPGIFAAGTVRAGCLGRAAAAGGDGAAAALAADRFLTDGHWRD
jgi:thioredoxin reductase (NADPH)